MSTLDTDDVRTKFAQPTAERMEAAYDFVSRFAQAWARSDADALRDLMQPDTQNLIPPMAAPGDREAVVEHFRDVMRRLPDLKLRILRWAATGDTVMIEYEASATVAGKALSWEGIDRVRLRSGKTCEGRAYWDTRGLDARFEAARRDAAK